MSSDDDEEEEDSEEEEGQDLDQQSEIPEPTIETTYDDDEDQVEEEEVGKHYRCGVCDGNNQTRNFNF